MLVPAFAVLWFGGVASHWGFGGGARAEHAWLASLFLFVAGLIVMLGARTRGASAALVGVALLGFAVEAVGVSTGFPFGDYDYTDALRPRLLGVPFVMGFAWMVLAAHAAGLVARLRLPAWLGVLAAALWTTAVDLIIDPLAANALGYWRWSGAGSYYGIPFTNFAGWFVTGLVAFGLFGRRLAPNFWASVVGSAIVLFFTLVALAHSLHYASLVGLVLCAAQLLVISFERRRD